MKLSYCAWRCSYVASMFPCSLSKRLERRPSDLCAYPAISALTKQFQRRPSDFSADQAILGACQAILERRVENGLVGTGYIRKVLNKHTKDTNIGSRQGQQITHGGLVAEGKRENHRTTIQSEGHHALVRLAGT